MATVEPGVARLVDLAHAAGPDGGEDFVRPEPAGNVQRHGADDYRRLGSRALYHAQGNRVGAREALSTISTTFTERLEELDLVDARRVLADCSHAAGDQ